jgi:hypothetical protein
MTGGNGVAAPRNGLLESMENAEVFTGGFGPAVERVLEPAIASGASVTSTGEIGETGAEPARVEVDSQPDSRSRRPKSRNRGANRPQPAPAAGAPIEMATTEAVSEAAADGSSPSRASCTMAQMRRFIKSRPYVPIHELRRRFEIEGCEDDVNPVPTDKGTIYVGLPPQEARFLADLVKAGEVGCELLLDPNSPGVVGVYAMRPVARQ